MEIEIPDACNEDYRRGYNDAIHFYEKHDAAREERIAKAESALTQAQEEITKAENTADSWSKLYGQCQDALRESVAERDTLKARVEQLERKIKRLENSNGD